MAGPVKGWEGGWVGKHPTTIARSQRGAKDSGACLLHSRPRVARMQASGRFLSWRLSRLRAKIEQRPKSALAMLASTCTTWFVVVTCINLFIFFARTKSNGFWALLN